MGRVKGVILAAGYGSRFLPITRVVPKELLPLVDRPAIDWVVQELVDAGVEELLVITSRRKRAVEDWFDTDVELQAKVGLQRLGVPNVRATFVRQHEMRGTGHAMLLARQFAGTDPVLVAFPDDLFGAPNVSAQLVAAYDRTGCAVLACSDLSGQDVSRYGVVDVSEQQGVLQVRGLVEKPTPGTEPSSIVMWGRFLYTPAVFDALAAGIAGHTSGEFFATDALRAVAEQDGLVAEIVGSERFDTGDKLGYLQAVVRAGMTHAETGGAFTAWLRATVREAP